MAGTGNTQDKYDRKIRGGAETLTVINSTAANQYFGRTAATSSTLGPTAVISTGLVNSNSIILFGVQNAWVTGSVTVPVPFAVGTISPAGFFTVAAVNSTTNVGSFTVMWELKNPTP